ncbi:condensation domain-containing protein [Microbacterium sp. P04]|uniref:condensation domain-containing protein n=1 Tax=Microbacterium sp. P04 TaxID=3366947 RepID=UPI0037466659
MRLTTVTRMTLPPGRLHSYVVGTASDRGRSLPVSFDQRRHVGEGQRPGSWMAVSFRLPAGVARDELAAAWLAVIARHGTFRTVFGRSDAEELTLHELTVEPGGWEQHPIAPGRTAREVVRDVFDQACAPFESPSYRLCLLEPTDEPDRGVVVIGADHSHVDMWSWHVVIRDLLDAIADVRAGRPPLPGEVSSFAQHSAVLEAMPPAPDDVSRRWEQILAAEAGSMPLFPLPLGDVSHPRPAVVEVRDVLDAAELRRFDIAAAAAAVRPIALAMSVLTRVTRTLADAPLRAVFPVHSRHEDRWHDAVGWFITNAVIESDDDDPLSCARAVREAMALGSHPLAPILAPYGGMPVRPGMFAISWLDARRMAMPIGPELEIQHVSAAIATDGVMIWFIATEAGMQLRSRYPDTPEARANVSAWLDAIEAGLEDAAAR